MTKLILIPSNIPQELPNASPSSPERIRILAQIIEYYPNETSLLIDKVPTIERTTTSIPIKINVYDFLESSSMNGLLFKGTLVNIEAIYDGESILPVEIYEVNGANFTEDNSDVLQKVNRDIIPFD
ncbi:hypothetical protein SBY92_004276 [Candida maltosa Xu316]|uniref:Uncharacterized protein n=1 Tax=Candida maltosa (strain Xu316) TaxID=1245528 RepID=M3K0Y7_CANMX|nr:hypothetical protein G210_0376 [Candida maltosa Xu316]